MYRIHICRRSAIGALTLLVSLLVICAPAYATFPGKNGRISFIMAGEIFTMNPDGSDVKQLTSFVPGGNTANLPFWSPDGRQLVFGLTSLDQSSSQLWIMNGDGTNQRLLLNDPSFFDSQPAFSPDGKRIAFTRCVQNCAIYTVGTDGTGLEAVTHFDPNLDVFDFMATYSPDGKTMAFSNTARGGVIAGVYAINVDGSKLRRLTPPAIEGWSPNWAPDGQKLTFVSHLVQGVLDEDILLIRPDGSGQEQLTNNNRRWNGYLTGPHAARPSWSPQGDAIVFEQDVPDFSTSAIFILKTDGTTHVLMYAPTGKNLIGHRLTTARTTVKRPKNDRLRLIEQGGMSPNWGPAPQ